MRKFLGGEIWVYEMEVGDWARSSMKWARKWLQKLNIQEFHEREMAAYFDAD